MHGSPTELDLYPGKEGGGFMQWLPEAWGPILIPGAPVAELVVRVSAIYLFLWVFLRVMPTRQLGRFNVTDLLVLLLLAASVRMGLTGAHFTVGDALISATVLISWDRIMNAAAYHVGPLRSVMRQDPIPVIEEGKLVKRNARRELLTEADVLEKLREQGIRSIADVKKAYVEPDGRSSVIPRDPERLRPGNRTFP